MKENSIDPLCTIQTWNSTENMEICWMNTVFCLANLCLWMKSSFLKNDNYLALQVNFVYLSLGGKKTTTIFVWCITKSRSETKTNRTRSSWLNCALRDDEAVFWASIGHYEAVAVGNWWYWVSRGYLCLYILHKVEIWSGVTNAVLTHSLTHWQLWKIGLLGSLKSIRVELS